MHFFGETPLQNYLVNFWQQMVAGQILGNMTTNRKMSQLFKEKSHNSVSQFSRSVVADSLQPHGL